MPFATIAFKMDRSFIYWSGPHSLLDVNVT